MGNTCAPAEKEAFEPFRPTGGKVRVVIVVCNYMYSPGNELTGIADGISFQHMCAQADVDDITFLRDDVDVSDPLFPSKVNVKAAVADVGKRCGEEDYFIFFYAGHGENVPDAPPEDEDDGLDEAFVTPGPNQEIGEKHWLVDNDFVALIEKNFNPNTKILCICDCCHSGSIIDVNSHVWTQGHKICAIAAAQDDEESADTGAGGILTISIQKSVRDLGLVKGNKEYSINSVFKKTTKYAKGISTDQKMNIEYNNMDPALTAWPLPHAWWKM